MEVSISEYPLVVVGLGFFGSTVARQIAAGYELEVLVIDRGDHRRQFFFKNRSN
jgi:UDP-galactopyranose mutase